MADARVYTPVFDPDAIFGSRGVITTDAAVVTRGGGVYAPPGYVPPNGDGLTSPGIGGPSNYTYTNGRACNPGGTALATIAVIVIIALIIWLITWLVRPCGSVWPSTTTPAAASTSAVPGATTSAPRPNGAATTSAQPARNGSNAAPAGVTNARRINTAQLQQHKNSGKPFVVMFYWDSCGPCQQTLPHFDRAAAGAMLPMVLVNKNDIQPSENITAFPTIRAYNHAGPGTSIQMPQPWHADAIRQFANQAATGTGAAAANSATHPLAPVAHPAQLLANHIPMQPAFMT